MGFKFCSLLPFLYIFLSLNTHCSGSKPWVKVGYYYSHRSELPVSGINSALFTHLAFAFAQIDSLSYKVSINSSDSERFSSFTKVVKRKNPSVKTILSILITSGEQSSILSKLAQSSIRKSFLESSISTARVYGFNGLDLCGVEPRTELDMANLETLLGDWRAAIEYEAKAKNQERLLLVMLARPRPSLDSVSYPVDSMKKNLDWLQLETYNYYMPTETNIIYPHAALHDPLNKITNSNNAIQEWIKRGFPSRSLVLGLPYRGFAWNLARPEDAGNPFGAPAAGPAVTLDGTVHYNFLKWHIQTNGHGAKCVYNYTYVVNYCTIAQTWINFDGVEAIRDKVSYAKKMELLGYFAFHVGIDDNWLLSRTAHGEDGFKQKKKLLLTIILPTSAIFVLLIGVVFYFIHQRIIKSRGVMNILKRSVSEAELSAETNDSNLQVLRYKAIKAATNDFSTQNILGQGGFGTVYKGKLKKGQEVAVKRLSKTSTQGLVEFQTEVMLTAKLQHVNLVRVLGYCTEREEKLLIYEYMPNKSLDLYLFDLSNKNLLDWKTRVNIIEGVTQGLLYLQEYSNFTIIHRDLKASNILLDNELNAKISDFGMARIFSKGEHEANTGRIVGTYGYIPPEYAKKGIYSTKYDVYSFGVLLLQILSGKRNTCLYGLNKNLNLLEYAYELWKEGQGKHFIDPTLDDLSPDYCKILRYMQAALLCVQENPIDRPSMLEVSSMLKNENATIISPKKPAFCVKQDESVNIARCSKCGVWEENCSTNDTTISQLTPR